MNGNNMENPRQNNIDAEDPRLTDAFHKIAEEKQTDRDPEERGNAIEGKE